MSLTFGAQTMSGAAIALSETLPATEDVIGYDALTYITVLNITDIDVVPGKSFTPVEFTPLETRQTQTRKGSFTFDPVTANGADKEGDPGQELAKTGVDSDACFAFRITFENGTKAYFSALIMSFNKTGGDNNTIVGRTLNLMPNTPQIEVQVSGILTASVTAGGTFTGVTDGSFKAIQASSDGSGISAEFQITLAAGAFTAIELISRSGFGYAAAEVITLEVQGGPVESVAATITVDSVLAATP